MGAAALLCTAAAGAETDGVEPNGFTEEQRQALHDAREAEIRDILGLDDDAEVPSRGELDDAQRELLAEARADDLREILGLEDDAELPTRGELTDEQRDLIVTHGLQETGWID